MLSLQLGMTIKYVRLYTAILSQTYIQVETAITGSSLLTLVDRLAFEVIQETSNRSVGNIGTIIIFLMLSTSSLAY